MNHDTQIAGGLLLYVTSARADEVLDLQLRIQSLGSNPRLKHYVRIPQRICSCLDWFGVQYNHKKAVDILRSYYLFIGIVDNALDTISINVGVKVLDHLRSPCTFSMDLFDAPVSLITENLKTRIEPEVFPLFIVKMEELYAAVCREQSCLTMTDYIRERKLIGELTAEISYLLLIPNFGREVPEVRQFMIRVGEIGCLVDSLIDLYDDAKNGLIQFVPSVGAYLKLLVPTLTYGTGLVLKYPRLLPLFVGAIVDNIKDPKR